VARDGRAICPVCHGWETATGGAGGQRRLWPRIRGFLIILADRAEWQADGLPISQFRLIMDGSTW
jgi:hypothetical protein